MGRFTTQDAGTVCISSGAMAEPRFSYLRLRLSHQLPCAAQSTSLRLEAQLRLPGPLLASLRRFNCGVSDEQLFLVLVSGTRKIPTVHGLRQAIRQDNGSLGEILAVEDIGDISIARAQHYHTTYLARMTIGDSGVISIARTKGRFCFFESTVLDSGDTWIARTRGIPLFKPTAYARQSHSSAPTRTASCRRYKLPTSMSSNVAPFSIHRQPATPSSIAVLALTGDDHTLSVSDIDEKLRAGTVLALFGPSRELLETIHEATNTPIDIPSLELADGLPLLVYMVNGVVHIDTNNFPCEYKIDELVRNATPGDAKAPEEEEPESFSVLPVKLDPVEQTIRSILSAVSETLDAKDSTSILEPPPDVVGFKRGTFRHTLRVEKTRLAWREDGQANVETQKKAFIQIFDLYWFVRYYAYATGADCRGKTPSEFTEAGGVVYTLVLDQGYLKRSSDSAPRYKGPTEGFCGYYLVDCHRTGHHSENSSMRVVSYQPSGLTSSSGTTYNHSIRFEQDMQMLGNGGNSLHTFKARYSKDYSLPKFQQHEVLNRSVGVDFSVDYNDYYDHWADPRFKSPQWWNVFEQRGGYDTKLVRDDLPRDDIPINGLTVFSSSVGRHTLTSRWYTEFAAFKSNSWWTTDDRDDGSSIPHLRLRTYSTVSKEPGWPRTLDLTWRRLDYGSSEAGVFGPIAGSVFKRHLPK